MLILSSDWSIRHLKTKLEDLQQLNYSISRKIPTTELPSSSNSNRYEMHCKTKIHYLSWNMFHHDADDNVMFSCSDLTRPVSVNCWNVQYVSRRWNRPRRYSNAPMDTWSVSCARIIRKWDRVQRVGSSSGVTTWSGEYCLLIGQYSFYSLPIGQCS